MFRKLSLLVIVASFMGVNAAGTTDAQPGVFSRMGTAIASAAKSAGNVVVLAFTPSTYTNAAKSAWENLTWENVKAAPGNSLQAMYNHPYKTLAAATIVGAAVYAYVNRDALLGNEEDKEDKDVDLEYWPKEKAKSQQ